MSTLLKSFFKWFEIKPKLNEEKQRPPFQEREVWMCHFGTNIGFELDGKNDELLRPVVVFKKLSHETFLAIPLSGHQKIGSWYSPSCVNGKDGRYCLNQIRMIDAKRLKYCVEQITSNDFKKLKSDFDTFLNI